MPRPGFYNDNEHRDYPFVQNESATGLPDAVVVDVGLIMGLDCEFNENSHKVWLYSVEKANSDITFVLKTDAHPNPLIFVVPAAAEEWTTIYAESAVSTAPCAEEPVWSGFLVVGLLNDIAGQTIFPDHMYMVEPARIQNLARSYLRSISVGNYSRVTVPPCADDAPNDIIDLDAREIVPNATCLKNHIRFEEGYNCRITQIDRVNTIDFSAERGAGKKEDSELCSNGGEVPLFAGETKPDNSSFFSGGPACRDVIFTINGVGGNNVNFIGGKNIAIGAADDAHTLKVTLNDNIQGGCNE